MNKYVYAKGNVRIYDAKDNTIGFTVPVEDTLKWFPSYFYMDWKPYGEPVELHLQVMQSAPKKFQKMKDIELYQLLTLSTTSNQVYIANKGLLNQLEQDVPSFSKLFQETLVADGYSAKTFRLDQLLYASYLDNLNWKITHLLGIKEGHKQSDSEQLFYLYNMPDNQQSDYIRWTSQYRLLRFLNDLLKAQYEESQEVVHD